MLVMYFPRVTILNCILENIGVDKHNYQCIKWLPSSVTQCQSWMCTKNQFQHVMVTIFHNIIYVYFQFIRHTQWLIIIFKLFSRWNKIKNYCHGQCIDKIISEEAQRLYFRFLWTNSQCNTYILFFLAWKKR